jgi:hypothetical protein
MIIEYMIDWLLFNVQWALQIFQLYSLRKQGYMTGVNSGAGTAYHSRAPEFIPGPIVGFVWLNL